MLNAQQESWSIPSNLDTVFYSFKDRTSICLISKLVKLTATWKFYSLIKSLGPGIMWCRSSRKNKTLSQNRLFGVQHRSIEVRALHFGWRDSWFVRAVEEWSNCFIGGQLIFQIVLHVWAVLLGGWIQCPY